MVEIADFVEKDTVIHPDGIVRFQIPTVTRARARRPVESDCPTL